jgi:ABC-type phosphate transport system permease subunit
MIEMNARVKLDGVPESIVASEFLEKNLSITTQPREDTFITRLTRHTLEHLSLFLYSLLPIVINTYSGLHDIPLHIRESAEALGLSSRARLRLVELPMASRSILAGIKTSGFALNTVEDVLMEAKKSIV